jgi:NADPH:quinone reductase-like Zn-dependent oxidoreductase
MRAITFRNYGGPSVLALEELPTPQPGPGEVLVKVSAAGINRADVAAVAVQEGETLLLTGAEGAVGRAATQLAHHQGARVIGVQRSSNSAGTDYVIDIQKEALHEAVQALTRGAGVDIVLDAVGGDLFEPALKSLRLGGRQIAIASPGKRRVEFDLIDFFHNVATLHGVDSSGFTGRHAAGILNELRAAFDGGELKPLLTDETLLDHAAEAYETVKRGTHQRQVLILKK